MTHVSTGVPDTPSAAHLPTEASLLLRLKRSTTLMAFSAVVVCTWIAWVAWQSFAALQSAQSEVDYARRVQMEFTLLRSNYANAHVNARRAIRDGDANMIGQAEQLIAAGRKNLATLQELTRDDPMQQRRIVQMVPVLDEFAEGLQRRMRPGSPEEAARVRQQLDSDVAPLVPDFVRLTLNAAQQQEDRIIGQRMAARLAQEKTARDLTMGLIAAALATILVAIRALRADRKRLVRAQSELSLTNADLERRVEERTAVIRREQARIEGIFEAMSDGVLAFDLDLRHTFVSRRAGELLGRDPAAMLGRTMWEVYPTQDRNVEMHALIQRALDSGKPLTGEVTYPEFGGACFSYYIAPGPGGVTLYFHDVTQRRRNEVALRDMARRMQMLSESLITAWEDQRRALARELHDEIGQNLTAIKFNFAALASGASPVLALRAADGIALASQVISQVRDQILELHPALLDLLGLTAAVDEYLQRQAERSGIKIDFSPALPLPRLTEALELAAFRVVQEAVHNALRHAQCSRIEVVMEDEEGNVLMEVRDNGRGFTVTDTTMQGTFGMGVGGMRERVTLLAGRFAVESAPGRGTVVRAALPLVLRPTLIPAPAQAPDAP